jgi:hypothetical protein
VRTALRESRAAAPSPLRCRRLSPLLVAALLLAIAFSAHADVGGELSPLERAVGRRPYNLDARRELADAYDAAGFIEEAIAQRLTIIEQDPGDAEAPARINQLLARRAPRWLPEAAARIAPFARAPFDITLAGPDGARPSTGRFLLVAPPAVSEDGQRDPLHGWPFAQSQYAYAWDAAASRWVLKIRAHAGAGTDAQLLGSALRALVSFYHTALVYLRRDPTATSEPVDMWLTDQGSPGARSIGNNIYLYAASTPRTPAEWLREIAHEYGHIALPGVGGFTISDDPWADGDLGELLFVKWLAACHPESVGQELASCRPSCHPERDCHPERSEGSRRSSPAPAEREPVADPSPPTSCHRGGGAKSPDCHCEPPRLQQGDEARAAISATAQPLHLPWPIADAERIAAARRQSLIAAAAGKPDPARLKAHDTAARDYFLGLALRVEAAAGPRFLAESLSRCPRGTAPGFVKAVNALAKERGVTVW